MSLPSRKIPKKNENDHVKQVARGFIPRVFHRKKCLPLTQCVTLNVYRPKCGIKPAPFPFFLSFSTTAWEMATVTTNSVKPSTPLTDSELLLLLDAAVMPHPPPIRSRLVVAHLDKLVIGRPLDLPDEYDAFLLDKSGGMTVDVDAHKLRSDFYFCEIPCPKTVLVQNNETNMAAVKQLQERTTMCRTFDLIPMVPKSKLTKQTKFKQLFVFERPPKDKPEVNETKAAVETKVAVVSAVVDIPVVETKVETKVDIPAVPVVEVKVEAKVEETKVVETKSEIKAEFPVDSGESVPMEITKTVETEETEETVAKDSSGQSSYGPPLVIRVARKPPILPLPTNKKSIQFQLVENPRYHNIHGVRSNRLTYSIDKRGVVQKELRMKLRYSSSVFNDVECPRWVNIIDEPDNLAVATELRTMLLNHAVRVFNGQDRRNDNPNWKLFFVSDFVEQPSAPEGKPEGASEQVPEPKAPKSPKAERPPEQKWEHSERVPSEQEPTPPKVRENPPQVRPKRKFTPLRTNDIEIEEFRQWKRQRSEQQERESDRRSKQREEMMTPDWQRQWNRHAETAQTMEEFRLGPPFPLGPPNLLTFAPTPPSTLTPPPDLMNQLRGHALLAPPPGLKQRHFVPLLK